MRPHPLFLALSMLVCLSALPASAAFTELVSISSSGEEAANTSRKVAISADGRYVTFQSLAGNLVPHDSGPWDIFVRDRLAATTEMVSLGIDGEQIGIGLGLGRPAISADGRYVAFTARNPDTETEAVVERAGAESVGQKMRIGTPHGGRKEAAVQRSEVRHEGVGRPEVARWEKPGALEDAGKLGKSVAAARKHAATQARLAAACRSGGVAS